MVRLVLLFLCAVLAGPAMGQWSTSDQTPLIIGDRSGEQVQPKLAAAADGSTYIAWFDNAAGGYDVYLQRLSGNGTELWPHGGVLVANRGVSSTQDYDLDVDLDGNAILAFNDDRFGNAICVTKVSPTGNFMWGAAGTQLTPTGFLGFPHVAVLDNGNFAIGYSVDSSYAWTVLDSNGSVLNTQTFSETGKPYTLSDIVPSTNGEFIVLYIRRFNTMGNSAKALWSQKFDPSGIALWNGGAPIPIYAPTGSPYGSQGGSIQNGYFPSMTPDGTGGAVYAWYETGGPRNGLVQHVDSTGNARFPAHGATNATTSSAWIRTSCSAVYDPPSDTVYSTSVETNASTQSQFRVFVQKHDGNGSIQWGATGIDVLALSNQQPSFAQAVLRADGVSAFGFHARSALTGVVFGAGVNSSGAVGWNGFVHSVDSAKGRLTSVRSQGHAIVAWQTGSPFDVVANRVNDSGALGNPPEASPSAYAIHQGDELSGSVSALAARDDQYVTLLSDALTLRGEIEAWFTLPAGQLTQLWLATESSSGRLGLALTVQARNYVLNTWTVVGGGAESGLDTERTFALAPGTHLSGARESRVKLIWEPINDEDPAQDGWALNVDWLRVIGS